jgi:GT2 family glycosyltransferase
MRFSIVIPTYRRRDILARTLPTLLSQDFPAGEYELVVVVGDPADGTVSMLRSQRPACALQIIEQVPNTGQAEAKNIGIRAAKGDAVLILDDDVICDASLLSAHAAAHADARDLVVFGPVLVHDSSPDSLPALWLRRWTEDYLQRLEREGGRPRFPHEIWICSNVSVPRWALLEIGGFDARMRRTHDDGDLAIRLWKLGLHFAYEPMAKTWQVYVKDADTLVLQDAVWHGLNEVLLCRRHPEYVPYSDLARIEAANGFPKWLRRAMIRAPFSIEPLLRPAYKVVEALRSWPLAERAGLRLLQLRRSIPMWRSAAQACGGLDALEAEFGFRRKSE